MITHQKKEEFLSQGWTEKELQKAVGVLQRIEPRDAFFSKIIFWSVLVVIIFANILVSLVLIPFLIVLNHWILYFTVIIMAGIIGFLYNFLVMDLGHLEKNHHILAGFFVPLLALINLVIMVLVSNRFILDLKIKTPLHNPWLIGIVFMAAFITPYLISRIRGKHQIVEE